MYLKQVAPTLIKADAPWSARRGNLSEKDRVLKTVKGYLFVYIVNSNVGILPCLLEVLVLPVSAV